MNAEFLEKILAFETDPDHPGRIKPFKTRKGLSHDSFVGATGTLSIDDVDGSAIITGAFANTNGVFFQAALSNVTVSCQYNPETGVINGTIMIT